MQFTAYFEGMLERDYVQILGFFWWAKMKENEKKMKK